MSNVKRQARGRARIESILDATEQLVAEVGYDELTTNGVAARAGISPGSLYQFFGSKNDLLTGLLDRYTTQFRRFWDEQLADLATLPIEVVIERVIDATLAFKQDRPAYFALLHGSATSEALDRASGYLADELADRLDALYAVRAPHLDPERRRLVAQVSVTTVKSLLSLVMTPGGRTTGPAAMGELQLVLSTYLTAALGPPPPAPPGEAGPAASPP